MSKKIGEIRGEPVYIDPAVKRGKMYMINNHDWTHANCKCQVMALSRWPRLKYRARRLSQRLRKAWDKKEATE